tara:strand:+ start:331 stop:516 length:186 start_codon:yes stop_codon:yes gene_type:complete
MTKAEKIYERFVNYEWSEVSDSLKESTLKAINEALCDVCNNDQVLETEDGYIVDCPRCNKY